MSAVNIKPNPAIRRKDELFMRTLIGAGCTWTYELCAGHTLEFLKIAKQTNPEKSYMSLIGGIVKNKGVLGLLDGFFPWGTVQALAKGAVFSFAAAGARRVTEPLVRDGSLQPVAGQVIAGGFGGGVQGLVLSPTLLLKTRVMTDPIFRSEMSFAATSRESARVGMQVIQVEGVRALMKGSIIFSLKRVADWSTRFFFSSVVELYVFKGGNPDVEIGTAKQIGASLLGGFFSALVTIPMDVLVAQIQQASKAGEKVGVVETFMKQFRQGGLRQTASFATGGFIARVAHVSLTTALMKTATSVVYDHWEAANPV